MQIWVLGVRRSHTHLRLNLSKCGHEGHSSHGGSVDATDMNAVKGEDESRNVPVVWWVSQWWLRSNGLVRVTVGQ